MLQDIRYAFRMLFKSKGYTAIAVAALALGIGANTANFSVADAFLLKPVALPHLESLVVLMERAPHQTANWTNVSPADYLDWKRQSQSFAEFSPYEWDEVNLTGAGEPERIEMVRTAANFFDVLGAHAMLGCVFLPDAERAGQSQSVVLSYGLWQRRFGGHRGIVGKTIKLDGLSTVVTGVMGKKFNFPVSAELWLSWSMSPQEGQVRGRHYLAVVARLKPGVSPRQASAEMNIIARRLGEQYPRTNRGWSAHVIPIRHFVAGDLTTQYTLMMMAAVGFVLLIACANVANVQFARGAARQREFAVRTAVGASRWRVVRQLLTESMVLSLAGAVVGLAVAEWGVDLIQHYMPADIARYIAGWYEISLDHRAFAFALGVAVLSGIISGLAPAIQSSKPDLNETLKESGRGTSAGRSRQRIRSVLVVAELALALVLLVGAGLMVKGVNSLLGVQQFYDPQHILSIQMNLPDGKYKDSPQRAAFYGQVLERLHAAPGIEAAAIVRSLPDGDGERITQLAVEGVPPDKGEYRSAQLETISADYFTLMHMPLREGRALSDRDGAESLAVAVVSESMAARYWPGRSALGRRIKAGPADEENPWLTIVGVVRDVRYSWFDREPPPVVYRSYRQAAEGWTTLAIRTHGSPMQVVRAVRQSVAQVDPDQPLAEIKPLDRVLSEALLGNSYVAVMMSVLGVIALVLAAVGVSGLMAYAVTERTHEIGVRLALGAQRDSVLRMLVGRGMFLTAIGLAIGLAGAVFLARLLSNLIYGVSATDWTTFGGVAAAMAIVSLAASYIPARRAALLDPTIALRHE
ncbi:MAG TPA: ABC transporter permease [Bryobacteraceae bacterium]|jgi:putative ABC transport system permease protein|nr:ABC transporter permease [Bryobacteraceae bacterium]